MQGATPELPSPGTRRGKRHAEVLPAPSMRKTGPVGTSRHVTETSRGGSRTVARRRAVKRGADTVHDCRSRLVEDEEMMPATKS
jgi:hypothetical protein